MKNRPPKFGSIRRLYSNAQMRSAFRLQETIRTAAVKYGVGHVLTVTLTFPYPVHTRAYTQKQLNSLLNYVRENSVGYIWTIDLSFNGVVTDDNPQSNIHYHLILVVDFDVLTDTDVEMLDLLKHGLRHKQIRYCNSGLREYWKNFERAARARNFGRVHMSPIIKNADAVACYYTNNIKERWHLFGREQFRRVRIWNCSKNLKCTSDKFQFINSGWKYTVEEFLLEHELKDVDAAAGLYGEQYWSQKVFMWERQRTIMKEVSHDGEAGGDPDHTLGSQSASATTAVSE